MGEKRDFIREMFKERDNPEDVWNGQYQYFSKPLQHACETLANYGVHCITDFSLADLKKIEKYNVFTLFAHYNEKRSLLELADGLYTVDEYVDGLPIGFKGIFDITACDSDHLRDGIKKKFDNQVIAYCNPIGIHGFMALYKQIIFNLTQVEINYIDCFKKTIEDLTKKK
jgi:hypothetical protein